jgi:7-cyano-7-deazaguanine synthase in queuosine biosynthesis
MVLWSAGVDSTYSLLRLLADTSDEVLTHHVVLAARPGAGEMCSRGRFESAAIDRLRPELVGRARDFVHTVSWLDPGVPREAGLDASLLAFMAARVARQHGFTFCDRVVVGVNGDEDPGWDPESAACALRRARIVRALRAAWGCDEVPQLYLWEPRPSKAAMGAYLGPRIMALTASCRRPEWPAAGGDARACGECAKCRRRERSQAAREPGSRTATLGAARTRLAFRDLVESRRLAIDTPGEAEAGSCAGPEA